LRVKFGFPRLVLLLSGFAATGCAEKPSGTPTASDVEAEIRANLAQLGPEDARLAERQQFCPMMEGIRLGEMGRPYKVNLKGISAFVCCENCRRAAEKGPDQALARFRQLMQDQAKEGAPRAP
jgi:hypothetical protein